MGVVFVGCATQDAAVASRICAALEAAGIPCWLGVREAPTSSIDPAASSAAISAAKLMLLVLTGHASSSEEVSRDLGLAGRAGLPLIPVRTENVVPAGPLQPLAERQSLDLFPDFNGQIPRLVDWVRQTLAAAGWTVPARSMAPPPLPAGVRSLQQPRPPLVPHPLSGLLLGLAVVQLALLAWRIPTMPSSMLTVSSFPIPILIGLISGIAKLVAAILLLRGARSAQPVALIVCSLSLLSSLYSAYLWVTVAMRGYTLDPFSVGLTIANLAILITIIVFLSTRRSAV